MNRLSENGSTLSTKAKFPLFHSQIRELKIQIRPKGGFFVEFQQLSSVIAGSFQSMLDPIRIESPEGERTLTNSMSTFKMLIIFQLMRINSGSDDGNVSVVSGISI